MTIDEAIQDFAEHTRASQSEGTTKTYALSLIHI